MNNKSIIMGITIALMLIVVFPVFSAEKAKAQEQQNKEQKKQAYGWQLMTTEERKAHRMKMLSFKTEQERREYRKKHHKQMQARAKLKGVELPEKPMERGRGMGDGRGRGMSR